MTSLRAHPLPQTPAPVAPPPAAFDSDTAPPLPAKWVRKVRATDVRLQRRMRMVTVVALVAFVMWGGWVLLF